MSEEDMDGGRGMSALCLYRWRAAMGRARISSRLRSSHSSARQERWRRGEPGGVDGKRRTGLVQELASVDVHGVHEVELQRGGLEHV